MKTPLTLVFAGGIMFSWAATSSLAGPVSAPGPVLRNFQLVGDLSSNRATFTLTAIAKVDDRNGGSLDLLAGTVALTELDPRAKWRMRAESNRYVAVFDRRGEYPVQVKFTAAVRASNDWNSVDFQVAPGAPQPFVLQGLAADTQFQFPGASRPERKGNEFTSYLPSDGMVKLSWKEARKAGEGKLFYAAEMLAQVSVSPGLMQQTALLDFKVMQGELNRVSLFLHGDGEVTRVSGDQVLAWNLEPVSGSADRRLVIQLNQPQKDSFSLQVQLQTSLGAFPQTAEAMRLQPEGATRFAGYFRVVNEGAVRLEVAQASGLSQISPEQFPESDVTRAALRVGGSQRFAYRFSSADYGLRVQADQIQPELSVSEILAYNHGQNELAIDAEIELDVREAPLRELLLRVPKGYAIARINASGMSDYFLSDPLSRPSDSLSPSDGAKGSSDQNDLRIIYGQPVSGRQVIQLRLERNKPLDETSWNLPRVEVAKAKSVRGNIGISADAGFRLSAERSQSLTEIATAFFPRKVANLQTAFRISDPAWEATMRVERLPQTVQADALHLFSIGEGVAYGSSVINYQISGAPLSLLRVELSDEYFNVEFTGKDVRNWQKTTNGYVVQLHSPVSGAYTLLATYERPFKSAGETLAFTGAQPLGVQSEQGHTIVISSYQFQVTPADVSSGLMVLEPGEVPAEYRLFFDAPILAAYRYTARPFDLRLALHPLEQGDSLNQVIDRAALETRVSQEGQVLTDARYFVKSRGNPNLRVTLPAGTRLWSAVVNDATVVPVLDVRTNIDSTRASAGDTGASVDRSLLIPLPQHAAPDAILRVQLKLAQTNDAKRVSVTAPILAAPVMLAEWTLTPDAGQRLIFRRGTLTPAGGATDVSGFAGVMRIFTAREAGEALMSLLVTWVLVGAALVVWRWTARTNPRRYSARHLGGALIGLIAIGAAIPFLMRLAVLAEQQRAAIPAGVALVAPVQAANSALTVEVANVADRMSTFGRIVTAWPALLALAVWVYGATADTGLRKTLALAAGWTCLIWAVLRFPNSAPAFVWLFATFLAVHVAVPALRRLWQLPRDTEAPQGPAPAISPVVTGWCIGALLALSCGTTIMAAEPVSHSIPNAPAPESVVQDIRVEDKFALATARIRWRVTRGDVLPLLQEPAVLTRATFPPRAFTLMQLSATDRNQQLRAEQTGVFDIELQYQIQIAAGAAEGSFTLPVRSGLINQLTITLANADVDVLSPQAVSVRREMTGSNTVATVVLSPADGARVAWRPRSRDVKSEKPVFYAEISQLYVPSAGVIEGAHLVAIRPAQGELSEITFDVPSGATVTDVTDGASADPKSEIRNPNSLVSLWRFDPDARKLRVTLSRAQSKPFTLLVLSQVATGTLPFGQNLGLLSVEGAASQIGLLGIATGNEVQLDDVSAEQFSPINLEDFPANAVQVMAAQFPGLTVRRAFRYSTPMTLDGSGFGSGTFSGSGRAVSRAFSLKASAVEPDVRVETQNTLSIGEDRTVLAANVSVDITRAGIFRLSFIMPPSFEVESISGSALSHWTESKTADGRAITMHFPAKTVGQRQFTISLAGPGVHATNAWSVPQLVIREAGKQQGTLLIVPEQGMRLQVAARDGVTQLDPQKSGIKQKGVLAFRVLETPANLTLDLEQVDPWIQVASLQHAIVSEAQVKIAANLQYQIENTGLKAFRVFVPTNAESVRFEGEQVADFLATPGALTNGLQEWTVKLHRRVIGPYLLRLDYQTPVSSGVTETLLRGFEAADVNLQRGFVTVQADARLQVDAGAPSAALQPAEWQSIPRNLQRDLPAAAANLTYRLVEPSFQLPLRLERHEPARLLPARVNRITFDSVVADDGLALTRATLEILPGDKRLLSFTIPGEARFWFAFVNQSGVWPWREADRILIPLKRQSRADQPITVDLYYSARAGKTGTRSLDVKLLAPKFDLPLENLVWRVSLNDRWNVKGWGGALQLAEQTAAPTGALDLQTYLRDEEVLQQRRTLQAQEYLTQANSALEQGDPLQARRAFEDAYGLSVHDAAFNEDARVQLHNIKLQQALVGLNVRQAAAADDADKSGAGGKLRELRNRKEINYTQQDAKDILDRNSADENSAFLRLAERLIQQQDAAVSSAAALRANLPEQGRVLTFKRAVVVDSWADLDVAVHAVANRAAPLGIRGAILGGTLLVLTLLALAMRGLLQPRTQHFAQDQ